MIRRRRHSLVLSLAVATLGLGYSATASADITGYVCQSGWTPNPVALASYLTNMGSYGAVYTYLNSKVSCKGSNLGLVYFCTTGATNSTYCSTQLYSETQAANLAASLQAAGASGQKVTAYVSAGSAAGAYIEFTQP